MKASTTTRDKRQGSRRIGFWIGVAETHRRHGIGTALWHTFFGLFVARILWEETFLTWNNGPQMVGFSMMHGGAMPAVFAGLIGLPLCLVWMIFAAGII